MDTCVFVLTKETFRHAGTSVVKCGAHKTTTATSAFRSASFVSFCLSPKTRVAPVTMSRSRFSPTLCLPGLPLQCSHSFPLHTTGFYNCRSLPSPTFNHIGHQLASGVRSVSLGLTVSHREAVVWV